MSLVAARSVPGAGWAAQVSTTFALRDDVRQPKAPGTARADKGVANISVPLRALSTVWAHQPAGELSNATQALPFLWRREAWRLGEWAGLSEAVIGLTIIAIGTSLPELMTCVVAAMKGHDDISIGNLVGSNVFNTLLVIGTAGAIRPFGINARLIGVDYWIMIAISAAFMIIAIFCKRIGRISGAGLLAAYVAYMVYLFVFTPGV